MVEESSEFSVRMAPVVDQDALRKQMGFMCVLACAVATSPRSRP